MVSAEVGRLTDTFLRTNAIPHLQTAEVPRDLALAFVRCRPLEVLTIWSTTVVDLTLATSIIEEITQRCPHFANFSASLNTFSMSWFMSAIQLPCLEELCVLVADHEGLGEDGLKAVSITHNILVHHLS